VSKNADEKNRSFDHTHVHSPIVPIVLVALAAQSTAQSNSGSHPNPSPARLPSRSTAPHGSHPNPPAGWQSSRPPRTDQSTPIDRNQPPDSHIPSPRTAHSPITPYNRPNAGFTARSRPGSLTYSTTRHNNSRRHEHDHCRRRNNSSQQQLSNTHVL
jgi:hypothetical protein